MKDLRAIRGRNYIRDLVAQGEHETQDFKFLVGDARKIARSISAFANNRGGCLLIGVKDNGTIAGVRNEEDVFVVEQGAQMYCHPPQEVEFTAFKIDAGVTVIRARVAQAVQRPVYVIEEGGSHQAYFRVKDENIVAHRLMVRAWRDEGAQSASVMSFSDGSPAARVLEAMGPAPVTDESLLKAVGISKRSLDDVLVNLVRLGLVEFHYNGKHFMLASK